MASLCYVAHGDGVPNGYAENNRTKEVVRWKATGQHLSPEAKADLAAQAEQKRYARKQAERELYEATANRLAEEQQLNISGVDPTEYHKAKQIEVTPGAPVRRGCCWCQATMWRGNCGRCSALKRMGRNGLRKIRANTDVSTSSVRRMATRKTIGLKRSSAGKPQGNI